MSKDNKITYRSTPDSAYDGRGYLGDEFGQAVEPMCDRWGEYCATINTEQIHDMLDEDFPTYESALEKGLLEALKLLPDAE